MSSLNLYEVLQVSRNAESEIIEVAYKKLAFKYHPDRYFGPDANEIMKNINSAYSVLRDPEKRRMYDLLLTTNSEQIQKNNFSVTNQERPIEDSAEKRIQNARKIVDITGSIGWMFVAYIVIAVILISILPFYLQQYIIPGVFVFLFIINVISRSVREKLLTKEELMKEREEEDQLSHY